MFHRRSFTARPLVSMLNTFHRGDRPLFSPDGVLVALHASHTYMPTSVYDLFTAQPNKYIALQ